MVIEGEDLLVDENGRVSADIVIAGAGAAGIIMARELSRAGHDVLVLEAGGQPPDDSRFEHFAGDNVGQPYDLVQTRYRGIGGATNVWAGWCRPLSEFEMGYHPWVGGLPWPISHSEMTTYSRSAADLLGLGAWDWDPASIAAGAGRGSLADVPGAHDTFAPVAWRFASHPLSFADRFADVLASDRTRIITHAPVTRINARDGVARNVVVSLASGRNIRIDFQTLILAAGGIENLRMLLQMQARLRRRGNPIDVSGWLGRGWQEHPHVAIGTALIPESVADGPLWMYTARRVIEGVPVVAGLSLPDAELARRRMSALSITIDPLFSLDVPYADGIGFISHRAADEPVRPHVLFARSESRTVRGSRVTLSKRLDGFGRPQVSLDWRVAKGDVRDLGIAARVTARAFADLGLGTVRVDAKSTDLLRRVWGGCHHIGGARMSRDPADGVTDEFGALHQLPNVYVTGSAIFPSGGFSNPTLTIVALALRQAERIAAEATR